MMTIPEIRAELNELAEVHNIPRLAELAEFTKRRSPIRRTRKKLPPLTPEQKWEIEEYALAFPDASYKEISEALNTNIGRVSETLAGKRQDA